MTVLKDSHYDSNYYHNMKFFWEGLMIMASLNHSFVVSQLSNWHTQCYGYGQWLTTIAELPLPFPCFALLSYLTAWQLGIFQIFCCQKLFLFSVLKLSTLIHIKMLQLTRNIRYVDKIWHNDFCMQNEQIRLLQNSTGNDNIGKKTQLTLRTVSYWLKSIDNITSLVSWGKLVRNRM